ncbi:MAG: DNA-binding transcriptional LysR family regulator [Halocynthiibacter sp.]|jgi:DNA-binding transcriptional LysR family regulator
MAKMHFDWDDLRVILAVARRRSVRGGAQTLNMHHSSVVRRISVFEKTHNVQAFERHPSGYVLTPSGEEIVVAAEAMENEALALERRVIGRDARLEGDVRLTMPMALATHLLMNDLIAFSQKFPGVRLDLNASSEITDLSRRETDVAIRMSFVPPPDHLVGRQAGTCAFALYGTQGAKGILGWTADARTHQFRTDDAAAVLPLSFNDVLLHHAACRAGSGMARLPRFIGDNDPLLFCIDDGYKDQHIAIWVLTHADLTRTARIRAVTEHMFHALKSHAQALDPSSYA